jgi:hypothetical protein
MKIPQLCLPLVNLIYLVEAVALITHSFPWTPIAGGDRSHCTLCLVRLVVKPWLKVLLADLL